MAVLAPLYKFAMSIQHFVVMGVTGCGKSSVATLLAEQFDANYIEADDLHGVDNIEKMARGEALNDDDRRPWLARVAQLMKESDKPVFVSCSALRRIYRLSLQNNAQVPIGFIHLHAPRDIISQRLSARKGHFMPVSLLDSQCALLEHLQADEIGKVVDISQSLAQVVGDAASFVVSSGLSARVFVSQQ